MIQIIQKPHRLQSLANGVSSGLAGLGQGYNTAQQLQQKKIDDAQTNQLLMALGIVPQDEGSFADKLNAPSAAAPQPANNISPEQTDAATLLLAKKNPQLANIVQKQTLAKRERADKEQKENQKKELLGGVLDRLDELAPQMGPWGAAQTLGGLINPELTEVRSEFDSLAISLEGALRDMATKGTLPQKTFQELLRRIPGSNKTAAENRGRIKAFRKLLAKQSPQVQKQVMEAMKGSASQTKQQPTEGLPDGFTRMQAPDGSIRLIPEDQVDAALAAGGKEI